MSNTPKQSQDTHAKIVSSFQKSAVNAIKVQCSYELSSDPSLPFNLNTIRSVNIFSIITLKGKGLHGTATLCFTEPLFLAIMGSLFEEQYTAIDDELADGAKELLNIIFGAVKTELNTVGFEFEKALPDARYGELARKALHVTDRSTVVLPFSSKDGQMFILINLNETANANPAAA